MVALIVWLILQRYKKSIKLGKVDKINNINKICKINRIKSSAKTQALSNSFCFLNTRLEKKNR